MGGVIIFTAIAVPYLLLSKLDWLSLSVFGVAIACALMGFADDYMKIVRRRSLGLRARTKLLLTVAISVALWWVATHKAGISSTIQLRPFDVSVDFGPLFPVFIYLVVAGTTTAVNFTDGLDGLAAGCTAITLLAYIGITFISGQHSLVCWPRAWSEPASDSSGTTASRRRSSWAIPARWVSAGRSPGWRS